VYDQIEYFPILAVSDHPCHPSFSRTIRGIEINNGNDLITRGTGVDSLTSGTGNDNDTISVWRVIRAAATQGIDQFIYNSSLGKLLFDADGTGAGAAVQIAFFTSSVKPVLTTSSVTVIA
jgi:Ca2+-binding RTX toxin-like protein